MAGTNTADLLQTQWIRCLGPEIITLIQRQEAFSIKLFINIKYEKTHVFIQNAFNEVAFVIKHPVQILTSVKTD